MKHEIPMRVKVLRPLAGVTTKVQRGKNELLAPRNVSADAIAFEFDITVDLSTSSPNFLGKYAQGPKDARFVYVNSGTYAGQVNSSWARRAKISLMNITPDQIETILTKPGSLLEVSFSGTGGRDGGPTCASVKGVEWKVADK